MYQGENNTLVYGFKLYANELLGKKQIDLEEESVFGLEDNKCEYLQKYFKKYFNLDAWICEEDRLIVGIPLEFDVNEANLDYIYIGKKHYNKMKETKQYLFKILKSLHIYHTEPNFEIIDDNPPSIPSDSLEMEYDYSSE